MLGINISVDKNQLSRISKAFERLNDFKEPLNLTGKRLIRSTGQNFDKEQSPDGQPFEDISEYTQAMRRKGTGTYGGGRYSADYKVLSDTGRLKNSITSEAGKNYVSVGTNVDYAEKMQFGDSGNMLNGFLAPIPARPFLGITPLDEKVITLIFKDYFKKVFYA